MICAELPSAIVDRIDADGDCWEWTGAKHESGYGRYRMGGRDGRFWYVHRLVWELLVGPIPDGLHIDHLCRNRLCCNPDHLEPVTPAENTRRSPSWNGESAKTHCPYGHPYSGDNLQTQGRRKHWRRCAACHAQRNREYRERRRNAV